MIKNLNKPKIFLVIISIITVSAKDNFTTFKMILQIILNMLLNKIMYMTNMKNNL